MNDTANAIAPTILRLCRERGPGKTICPSEVARLLAVDDDWRGLMNDVRAVAARLAASGEIVVTQRGEPVDVATTHGPVRLGLPKDRRDSTQ